MEVPELGRRVHLGDDVPRLEAVDLVQRDDDRGAEREHAPGDEPVARPDPFARREDEENSVDTLERLVDGPLHALCQRIERALEAGEIDEDELVAVAVGDSGDSPARGLRLVGDDCDLAPAERVHERRLADVGTACDRDEAGSHSSKVSGRSCSGVRVTTSPPAFLNVTRPILNSYSH